MPCYFKKVCNHSDNFLAACKAILEVSSTILWFSMDYLDCRRMMVVTRFKPTSGGFDYANSQLAPDVMGVQHRSSSLRLRPLDDFVPSIDKGKFSKQDVWVSLRNAADALIDTAVRCKLIFFYSVSAIGRPKADLWQIV